MLPPPPVHPALRHPELPHAAAPTDPGKGGGAGPAGCPGSGRGGGGEKRCSAVLYPALAVPLPRCPAEQGPPPRPRRRGPSQGAGCAPGVAVSSRSPPAPILPAMINSEGKRGNGDVCCKAPLKASRRQKKSSKPQSSGKGDGQAIKKWQCYSLNIVHIVHQAGDQEGC